MVHATQRFTNETEDSCSKRQSCNIYFLSNTNTENTNDIFLYFLQYFKKISNVKIGQFCPI